MHVSQIINKVVQTVTQAPTTKEKRIIPDWLKGRFSEFKTLSDPILAGMLDAAMGWCADVHANTEPYWISFVGPSGTGKTFLAGICKSVAYESPEMRFHKSLIVPVFKKYWPTLLGDLRDQEFWRIDECVDANVLFLDEISLEHDPSGFGADKLSHIMSGRVGKWTIITTNLEMDKIQAIDRRIASRMVRDGSVVVDCNTMDYAMR